MVAALARGIMDAGCDYAVEVKDNTSVKIVESGLAAAFYSPVLFRYDVCCIRKSPTNN
jgi:hypothetical protein